MYRSEQAKTYADGRAEALWEPKPPNPTPSVFLLFRGIRMERCWCDEERAPCSTKREKVSALTEARSARSWCDGERAPSNTKREKVSDLPEA